MANTGTMRPRVKTVVTKRNDIADSFQAAVPDSAHCQNGAAEAETLSLIGQCAGGSKRILTGARPRGIVQIRTDTPGSPRRQFGCKGGPAWRRLSTESRR